MNKGDLISAVADSAGLSKSQASDAVNAVFSTIQGALAKGEKGSFIGFGTFSTAHRAAREGRNPLTGKTIQIKAKTSVKFKAGSALTESVN